MLFEGAVVGLGGDPPRWPLGQPVGILLEQSHDVVAVLPNEPRSKAGADPVREEERLDLADRGDVSPGRDRALDALARDRPARLRAHLAQALGVSVERFEDVLGTEVVDDRACERPADS